MKKFASLLLALVMCLCCLTTAALAERAPVAKDDLKIGFIFLHDENSTYDLNFITAAKAACEKLGIAYETKTNIPEGQECYDAAAELADAGCDIIFADSFGHESYMIQAALEFPEVEFCHATGTKAHTENLPNYHNAFATIYEGRYLAGVAAGMKHRIGLFDMILLKDNHIDFAGGIVQAIDRCHAYLQEKGLDLKIEIEVRNFDELQQVLDHGGVNRIMLDNFTPADTRKAVELIDHRYEVESSGGITFDTIRDYAEQGVDFISVGALTHSVKGLDMSFKAIS